VSNSPNPAAIEQIIRAVTREPDGLRSLLRGVVQLLAADRGAIYRLHLDRSEYVLQTEYISATNQFASSPSPDVGLHLGDLAKAELADTSLIGRAILTRSIISISSDSVDRASSTPGNAASMVLVPILRGESCLGVLRLDSAAPSFDGGSGRYEIEFARSLILSLFERQSSLRLLGAVQMPIDFTQPLEDVVEDILLMISAAAGMPFIQIHELEEDGQRLRCIGLYGLTANEMSDCDLEPVRAFDSFSTALTERRTVVEPTIDIPRLAVMRERAEFSDVKSFVVVPVRAGKQVFGTVLFGAGCAFDYSHLEVAGFETIASSIGTAIVNSRNAHRLQALSVADYQIGMAITGLEVAQAARHEVRGTVDDCVLSLATMRTYLRQGKLVEAERTIENVEDSLSSISTAMDKIRNASRAPDDTLSSISLAEVWQEARSLVSAQLARERIQARIVRAGREEDSQIEALPDSLRHAFLHLLLNSIDAFRGARHKSHRLITISIGAPRERTNVKIRYVDNAGGINPAQFQRWTDAGPFKDVKTVIFDKGVTTKPSGAGYGLYLVRMILAQHHGAIELADYRGGVVFDITLPKSGAKKTQY
jgi:signal transduction histidine kinase